MVRGNEFRDEGVEGDEGRRRGRESEIKGRTEARA